MYFKNLENLETLDLTNRKILSELDKNSRISYSELGKKIRVAKETVKYRIEQLQKKRIIKGFYTVVNFSKIGMTVNRLYIRLEKISPQIEKLLIDYLINSDKIRVLYHINGPYHLALGIWTRDMWEYKIFIEDLKRNFGDYFSEINSSTMIEYREFSRNYMSNGKEEERFEFLALTKTEKENLNETDLKILSFLSNNARASLVEIAKELETSIVTVSYHLKSLLSKKVITGFRTIFDLQKLGKEYYKVDLWFSKYDKIEVISQNILSHPNVIYTEKTLISGDLEFDLEVDSFDHFISIMDSFKEKFKDEIRDYRYYSLIKNYKTSYVPNLF